MNETRALLDTFEHELEKQLDAIDLGGLKCINGHPIHHKLIITILQSHRESLQLDGDLIEHFFGRGSNICRELFEKDLWVDLVPFVVRAEVVFVPGFGVTTVAATSNVTFELHSVALVITLFEAVFANDASGIFLAIKTPPSHISRHKVFCTHCRLTVLIYQGKSVGIVNALARSVDLNETVLQEFFDTFNDLILRFLWRILRI